MSRQLHKRLLDYSIMGHSDSEGTIAQGFTQAKLARTYREYVNFRKPWVASETAGI